MPGAAIDIVPGFLPKIRQQQLFGGLRLLADQLNIIHLRDERFDDIVIQFPFSDHFE